MEFQHDVTMRKITEWLSYLESFITLNGIAGRSDFCGSAEGFFCAVLNEIYGLELLDLNLEEFNFPAIDLGDKKSKICYQITAVGSNPKLKDTVEKFHKYNLGYDYNHLVMLVISAAPKPRQISIPNITVEVKNLADLMRTIRVRSYEQNVRLEKIFSDSIVSSISVKENIFITQRTGKAKVGNCNALIKSTGYKYALEEQEAIRSDIESFSIKLSNMTLKERNFLYLILAFGFQPLNYAGYPAENEYYASVAVVENRFFGTVAEMKKLEESLDYHGLIYYPENYIAGHMGNTMEVFGAKFYGKADWNIFVPLMNFLKSKPREIDKTLLQQIIFHNDFSCFDDLE